MTFAVSPHLAGDALGYGHCGFQLQGLIFLIFGARLEIQVMKVWIRGKQGPNNPVRTEQSALGCTQPGRALGWCSQSSALLLCRTPASDLHTVIRTIPLPCPPPALPHPSSEHRLSSSVSRWPPWGCTIFFMMQEGKVLLNLDFLSKDNSRLWPKPQLSRAGCPPSREHRICGLGPPD